MSFVFWKSRLRRAIGKGLANGKLREELKELGDLTIKSESDAAAICWGLQQLNRESRSNVSEQVCELARLFQDVEDADCAAFQILKDNGIPELLELYDQVQSACREDDEDALMFILKILALYGTTEGTLKVIEATRQPLKPDGYVWSPIMHQYCDGHPQTELLFRSLSDPLPTGFIGVSLLDAANDVLLENNSIAHPFDSADGKGQLRVWLTKGDPDENEDSDEYSYANSAAAALPFLSGPERDDLLALALNHRDEGVRVKAAWASARLGNQDGVHRLSQYCLDFKHAESAKRYLIDLGSEDKIPEKSKDPVFEAITEFSRWLAHPCELGRYPDALELVDRRELAWPPSRSPKWFSLVKYRAKDPTGLGEDDVGCGLVGSITFCFFSHNLEQRPPEDCYAIHCCWEMEQAKLIEKTDVRDNPSEYNSMLSQWTGAPLSNLTMTFVAEISPVIEYGQRLVGLASGILNGQQGWVVLDGNESCWYPRSEMPSGCSEGVVLNIHIGSRLLRFATGRDRQKYLATPLIPKPAEHVILAYQKLLANVQNASEKKVEKAANWLGPVGKHLDRYARALAQSGRTLEIRPAIELLKPHWDHVSGYGMLGSAAYICGQKDIAEAFFLKCRNNGESFQRGKEMDALAELWCECGKCENAKDLLLDCLQRLIEESKTAAGIDKIQFEEWFQTRRSTLLKLFSSKGEEALKKRGIPRQLYPRDLTSKSLQ